ncbi:MAG: PLP-dependent aminotransferase family protein [Spirochaetes bacterium]|nr:PLP-dependent aminotransferase family protein [Spirochaetota bacterium]
MSRDFRLYKDDETPLYIQAADAVRAGIVGGEFRPGDRLPSVRKLSDELGVNPATIVAAYRILTREGLVESRAGSGAFVSEGAPVDARFEDAASGRGPDRAAPVVRPARGDGPDEASGGMPDGAPGLVDLAANAPPRDLFPLADLKRFIAEAIDADGGRAFEYQDTAGYAPLRRTLAVFLAASRRGGREPVDPADVHIVSGAQQGIDLAARALLRRGDVAAVETPGYGGARDAFVAAGARVEAIPVGPRGLDLQALERLASTRPLRLVHVNPSFQNPTGAVYDAENRAAIAGLAERYGFYVVEDDLFSDLSWSGGPPPSIRSFDAAGRVLFVKSFSKSLMPGLRIACLEAPAAMRERFAGVKRSIDISSNGLMQRVLDRFLSSGRLEFHLVAARERYRSAFAAFEEALVPYRGTGLSWDRPEGGINLWVSAPPGVKARVLAAECLRRGCAVAPESAFRRDTGGSDEADAHLRVSFGSAAVGELARGARAIGEAAVALGVK